MASNAYRSLQQQRVYTCLVKLCYLLFLLVPAAQAQHVQTELSKANELLAAEQYQQAYSAYLAYAADNALAQFNLGLLEYQGWGRAKNPPAACQWFQLAAEQGVPMAQELLGDCYRDGLHQPADFKAAQRWYVAAIESGLAQSACKLGQLYMQGQLVTKDSKLGLRWCEQAAAGGALSAQLYLGQLFCEGSDEVKPDTARCLYWYQQAAAANHAGAQYQLAQLLSLASVDIRDESAALAMAEAAAVQGFQPAYLLTAKLYMRAPRLADSQLPSERNLAKSYLWAKASSRVATNDTERQLAEQLLAQILNIMPQTWVDSLDKKVNQHLQQLSAR